MDGKTEKDQGDCASRTAATQLQQTKFRAMAQEMENWLPVSGYEGLYEVSDSGEVRSRRGVMKQFKSTDGYMLVGLSRDGAKITRRVHRIVCDAFNGKAAPFMDAAHLDGTRTNNVPSNLAWVSRRTNMSHKKVHGTHQSGESHGCAKLSAVEVAEIRRLRDGGTSLRTLGAAFGVSNVQVLRICRRDRWK